LLEKKIKKLTKAKFALPLLNGTIALHTSLLLAGIKENDEVIVPTITFIASVNSIKYVGANPIFMNVDKYLNLDQDQTIEFLEKETIFLKGKTINKKTKKIIKAIIIVHTFGNAAKFDKLLNICKKKNIKIIEDAAESLGTKYTFGKFKNKFTGTIGDYGIYSMNGNKIVTSGNGGILILKTKKDYANANYLVTQAKDDKLRFIHNNLGYNYKMSNISAALALAGLEKLNFYLNKKKQIRNIYIQKLKRIKNLSILESPDYAKNNNWLNLIKLKTNKNLYKIIHKLKLNNIECRPVWYPNHLQKIYKRNYTYKTQNIFKIIKNVLCVPSSAFLEARDISKVIRIIKKIAN